MWRFQSTPPRGWRLGVLAVHVLSTRISIHSTTRVETSLSDCSMDSARISIHSTTRVETPSQEIYSDCFSNFNPLHHEGGDAPAGPDGCYPGNFNPLHHEGGDYLFKEDDIMSKISIHSTTRVETFGPALNIILI